MGFEGFHHHQIGFYHAYTHAHSTIVVTYTGRVLLGQHGGEGHAASCSFGMLFLLVIIWSHLIVFMCRCEAEMVNKQQSADGKQTGSGAAAEFLGSGTVP